MQSLWGIKEEHILYIELQAPLGLTTILKATTAHSKLKPPTLVLGVPARGSVPCGSVGVGGGGGKVNVRLCVCVCVCVCVCL